MSKTSENWIPQLVTLVWCAVSDCLARESVPLDTDLCVGLCAPTALVRAITSLLLSSGLFSFAKDKFEAEVAS